MVVLVVVLLAIWLIVAVIGFVAKGLVWLSIIAIILFIATVIIAFVRRSIPRSRRS